MVPDLSEGLGWLRIQMKKTYLVESLWETESKIGRMLTAVMWLLSVSSPGKREIISHVSILCKSRIWFGFIQHTLIKLKRHG